MQDLAKKLESLGLDSLEAITYSELLKVGSQKSPKLLGLTGIKRSALKTVLGNLEQKGLVNKHKLGKDFIYSAADPMSLVNMLAAQEQVINRRKDQAEKLLDPLRELAVKSSAKPKLSFFVGLDGAREALMDTLAAKERTIRAFICVADLIDLISLDFFEFYNKKRVSTGLKLHIVRTFERDKASSQLKKADEKHLSSIEEKREVRFVSEDLAFPMSTFIYDNKVLSLASPAQNFALVTESLELCKMQKKLFDLIWKSLSLRSMPR